MTAEQRRDERPDAVDPDRRGDRPDIVHPEQTAASPEAGVAEAGRSRQSPLPGSGVEPDAAGRTGRPRVSLSGAAAWIAGVVLALIALALLI